MRCIIILVLLISFPSATHAGSSSSGCNASAQEGAFFYDKSSKDFFFCRDHNKGWESLNQIVFILNGLLPLSGDKEPQTDKTNPHKVMKTIPNK